MPKGCGIDSTPRALHILLEKQMKKRLKYFKDRRTTSHWPCPIRVNGLQPRTYGDNTKKIDYSILTPPDLKDLEDEIQKLL